MLNAVRLLVIYFAVNLHGGQVYFLLLSNPEKQMGRPGLTAADLLCVSVMDLAHCSSLTIALKN